MENTSESNTLASNEMATSGEMVQSDEEYLSSKLDEIKSLSNEALSDMEAISITYESTTKIPSKEANIENNLVGASQTLLNKINTEIDNILSVGESYKEMDNFLADFASTDLGFDLTSTPVVIEKINDFNEINDMDDLIGISIPTIEGFNGTTGEVTTPEVKTAEVTPVVNNSSKTTTASYTQTSSTSTKTASNGTSQTNTSNEVKQVETSKNEVKKDVVVENKTETKEEIKNEETIDNIVEDKSVTEVNTNQETSDTNTNTNTNTNTYVSPSNISSKTNTTVTTSTNENKNTGNSTTVTTKRVEKYVNGENADIVVQEPDEEGILDRQEQTTPEVKEEEIITEYTEPETIVEIADEDEQSPQTTTTKSSGSGVKTAIGVISGVALAGAAAAVGYSAIKKKKEDDYYE